MFFVRSKLVAPKPINFPVKKEQPDLTAVLDAFVKKFGEELVLGIRFMRGQIVAMRRPIFPFPISRISKLT
jgi:hypothetical protein